MITIFIRTLLIYLVLIGIMRLMGKRQIGELEVTDLVTTLLISEIASLPITNQEIPVSYAVIPMITLLFLEVLSSVILIRFPKLKGLVCAKPTMIILQGELRQKALLSLRISVEELMSEVRQQGYSDLSQIQDAILEKNGKLTLLPKIENAPATVGDLSLPSPQPCLMHVVFCYDSYNDAGLSLIGKNREWFNQNLKKDGIKKEALFCATANSLGTLYYIMKEEVKK